MITVKNLTHNYHKDGKPAVNNISFEIKDGETFWVFRPFWGREINHSRYF